MKEHKGMRPQDIVILLKMINYPNQKALLKDIAYQLHISVSEVSESINRSAIAGLIEPTNRIVMKSALLEFLEHGLRYVFPAQPGAITRGMNTAHSAPIFNQEFNSEENFVWPYADGNDRGQAILPLYPTVPVAVYQDEKLYTLLAACDVLRIGKVRERNSALSFLKENFYN